MDNLNNKSRTMTDLDNIQQTADKPRKIARRDFGKLLGANTVLLSTLSLAACGGGNDPVSIPDAGGGGNAPTTPATPGQPATPRAYQQPTPIADTVAQPVTIGSYQRKIGYFTWSVTAGGATRDIEVYIPKGARQREYWVGIGLPEGVKSNEFLADSGWLDIADQTRACLLIMKPGSTGKWGGIDTELEYVTAAMDTLVSSGAHYSAMTYHYLVGYGSAAAALQLFAAGNPLSMISQVYLEASADGTFNTRLNATGSIQIGNTRQPNNMDFAGALDINNNPVTAQRTFAAQYNRDVPIPTWFVGNTTSSLLSYWAGVNDSEIIAATDADFGQVYWQEKQVSNAIATAATDVRAQVAVKSAAQASDAAVTRNVYRFLTQYSGYDNNSVYGHFITRRLDYPQAIAAGSLLTRDHVWSGSATLQSYIVYVPESVRTNYSRTRPAPVVFATHGAGQTAFVFMEATDIKAAADRYGFIAVTYDTTTTPYLTDLVNLVKQDCLSLGVAADNSRLYVYGQSAGGGAVTSFARDATLVGTFAAFGNTSGTFPAAPAGASTRFVPFYMIYGEYDYWPMKFGPLAAGDWRGSQGGQYALSANAQNYWLQRLVGRTLADEVASPTYTLDDGIGASLVPQNTSINLILRPTATANRYRSYVWTAAGVPRYVWSQCYGRGHNMIPSDLNKLWEEWFGKWQRGPQADTLLYWRDGVGVGQPVVVGQT